ncbi:YidH family protein [Gloeothece verrucosa]|nr:DUF202 domain-containing protein [Gloeothece verrucosa]
MQLFFQSPDAKTKKPEKSKTDASRVREHLANERTYLAWMRTAISLMGFGVVISRLKSAHAALVLRFGYAWKLGLVFAIVGLLTVLLSTQHYFAVRHDIEEDTYEFAERWLILLSITVILLGTGIIYLVATSP